MYERRSRVVISIMVCGVDYVDNEGGDFRAVVEVDAEGGSTVWQSRLKPEKVLAGQEPNDRGPFLGKVEAWKCREDERRQKQI